MFYNSNKNSLVDICSHGESNKFNPWRKYSSDMIFDHMVDNNEWIGTMNGKKLNYGTEKLNINGDRGNFNDDYLYGNSMTFDHRVHLAAEKLATVKKPVIELRKKLFIAQEKCKECPIVLRGEECLDCECIYRHGTDRFIARRGRAMVKEMISSNQGSECMFCGEELVANLKFCDQCDAAFTSSNALSRHCQQKHH